jgi:hypothetical protein
MQFIIQTILEAQDNLMPPEIPEEVVEQEIVEEEESSPNIFGHFSDSIFQANFETVHPYNTRSKTMNKPSSENTTTLPPKKSKPTEIKQSHVNPNLDYDLVEDLKKLRANISVYEFLNLRFCYKKCYRISQRIEKTVIQAVTKLFRTTQKFLTRLPLRTILILTRREAFL